MGELTNRKAMGGKSDSTRPAFAVNPFSMIDTPSHPSASKAAFSFAHLSDPHLAMATGWPRPFGLLAGKRLLGFISWRRNRQNIHLSPILDALVADVATQNPDHVVVTGDLVNISLPEEFLRARIWLEELGEPSKVSVVPGNHDATVKISWARGLGQWQAWMTGDDGGTRFPYLRIRGPVAFVGVSTAIPTAPFLASGRVGRDQLRRLDELLGDLGRRGFFRVVLMHHPPAIGHGGRRKALQDRKAVAQVLLRAGAELVLHGHHHRASISKIEDRHRSIPVIGVASASGSPERGPQGARWIRFVLSPTTEGGYYLRASFRTFGQDGFATEEAFERTYPIRGNAG
jgi:3',5'-cyclic AMP phosphodiesterase CpdA